MLWWSGSVPDLGHLDLQTKEPQLLLCFLCGSLNTAGQWSAGTCGTGDAPSLKDEIPLAGTCQDPENHHALWMAPCGWSTVCARMEPALRHWDSSEHPLPPLLSERLICRALDKNTAQRWKAKVTSVVWVCDATGTQWTCPKKLKLGGAI